MASQQVSISLKKIPKPLIGAMIDALAAKAALIKSLEKHQQGLLGDIEEAQKRIHAKPPILTVRNIMFVNAALLDITRAVDGTSQPHAGIDLEACRPRYGDFKSAYEILMKLVVPYINQP